MTIVLNGTSGITTPGIDASGTNKFATTIGVGAATPAASGAGITFPATASASSDANTLDDYEEGTWTPTVTGAGGWSVGAVSNLAATYTKIGNTVRLYASFTLAGSSGNLAAGNYLVMSGIPFTPSIFMYGISNGAADFTASAYTTGVTYVTGGTITIAVAVVLGTVPRTNYIILNVVYTT